MVNAKASNLYQTTARLVLVASCELGKGMSWVRLFPVTVDKIQWGGAENPSNREECLSHGKESRQKNSGNPAH